MPANLPTHFSYPEPWDAYEKVGGHADRQMWRSGCGRTGSDKQTRSVSCRGLDVVASGGDNEKSDCATTGATMVVRMLVENVAEFRLKIFDLHIGTLLRLNKALAALEGVVAD